MSVYLAPIGVGLGDLIISLPALQFLIASGEETFLVARSLRQLGFEKLVPGLAGVIEERNFDHLALQAGDRYVNLRNHPLQTEFVWGSAEFAEKYPHYRIADILSDICADFGISADFKNLQALPFERRAAAEGKVVLVPGSAGHFKCWPTESWISLVERLRGAGVQCCIVGRPEESEAVAKLIASGVATHIPTATIEEALNVISSARAVISVDTGLLHLALQQNVPSVGLWSSHPMYLTFFRRVSHCFSILSADCQPECISQELAKKFNTVTEWTEWREHEAWDCPAGNVKRCMNTISVDAVYDALRRALSHKLETVK